jgi:outer membrane protein
MKNTLKTCKILTGICLFSFTASSYAQAYKIGYVEIQKVFSGYGKANEAEEGFKKDVEAEQHKVSQLESDIKKMQAEFEKKKDILQPEERSRKEEEIREKVQEFSMLWSNINKSLDAKRQKLEDSILEEIQEEIKVYGKKNGFTAILDSRLVLYGKESIDLTEEIIKVLNEKEQR